jgi:hypothetical protein
MLISRSFQRLENRQDIISVVAGEPPVRKNMGAVCRPPERYCYLQEVWSDSVCLHEDSNMADCPMYQPDHMKHNLLLCAI